MIISILTDNRESWFVPYGTQLLNELLKLGHDVSYLHDKQQIKEGDICFLLSCTRLVDKEFLDRNQHNIVVHASDLPSGKGFSPLQWQILEGKSEIVLTLFEVVEKVDAGPFYIKNSIHFEGTELLEDLRKVMAQKIIEMCLEYVDRFGQLTPIEQEGEETFYKRRTSIDDQLDPNKTIQEQFNLFRIADNDKFPLKFELNGHSYCLKIYKAD